MKNYILLITIITLILLPAYSNAQSDANHAEDEKQIRQIVQNLEDAWAAGDGKKFAGNFTEDSDLTVWNGMYLTGRKANEKGHQQIFDTFYKGTEIRVKVRKIHFLSDDVATVHLQSKMYRDGKRVEDVPEVVPLMVLQKKDSKWLIAVFQNTPIIERGELVVGRKAESGEKNEK
jgi:uncharacterized protein (TIGR02246 family)